MDSKGNDALLKTTRITEWTLKNGGYIPVAFGCFLLAGCAVAYAIAVGRGNVDAILPLISDAAGSPPQNGLFGTLVCLGGMLGVVSMIQRYLMVLEKNTENSNLVISLNRLSLVVGIGSILGITLVTGYPVNFYRNRDVWLMDVGLPHMIGGLTFFSLGLVYIALQCLLTLSIKDKQRTSIPMRVLFLFLCVAAFVHHILTVPEYFGGISHLYYINNTENDLNYTGLLPYPPTMGSSLKLPLETGGSYVSSAISEWLFVLFFCFFFFTFFNEAQEYIISIRIETENPHEGHDDNLSKPRLSQTDSTTVPEVKKLLRRDSTCQTMGSVLDSSFKDSMKATKKMPLKNSKSTKNGSKQILSNIDPDAKLSRLLNQCDSMTETQDKAVAPSGENKVSKKGAVGNGDASCKAENSDSEEKKAIERIDDVVQDAENNTATSEKITVLEENSTTAKIKDIESYPSSCTLSVQ